MGKITIEHIEKAYKIAKEFQSGKLSLIEASNLLIEEGMNQSSARGYIYTYIHMSQGETLTRTINTSATDYYLNQIHKESGSAGLKKALASLSQHFEYYENKSGASMKSQRQVYNKYSKLIENELEIVYPDEVDKNEKYVEGQIKTIRVNSYERNRAARQNCIDHFGTSCQVCDLNFEDKYGAIGSKFIHVHHKRDISTIGKEYIVNPKTDLIPVCPNCHSMLHQRKPAYSVKELKNLISANQISRTRG